MIIAIERDQSGTLTKSCPFNRRPVEGVHIPVMVGSRICTEDCSDCVSATGTQVECSCKLPIPATKQCPFCEDNLKLDEDLLEILGRPNFTCISIAEILRKSGLIIEHKAETEQAYVIYWLLRLYIKHGKDWRTVAVRFIADVKSKQNK